SRPQSTCWSGRRAALRIPLETDQPTSGAAIERVPACVPTLDPDSDTSDPSRPRRNRFRAMHPWRWSGTTGDAHEIRCLDPAVGSPPGVAILFPKRRLRAIRQGKHPKTHPGPVAATTDIPASSYRTDEGAAVRGPSVALAGCRPHRVESRDRRGTIST